MLPKCRFDHSSQPQHRNRRPESSRRLTRWPRSSKLRTHQSQAESPTDPLSDVLSLLKPCGQLFAAFDTAGAWSFSFAPYDGIKFATVLQGGCWGIVTGIDRPIRLEEGDCFLLNSGYEIVLSSDLSLPPQDSLTIMGAIHRDGIAVHNGGGEVLLIGGFFTFSSEHAALLLNALPPFANTPRSSNQAGVLRWSLDQLKSELREPMPGGVLVSNHLLHLMLVQVLRLHTTTASADSPAGWLRGLSDRRILGLSAALE